MPTPESLEQAEEKRIVSILSGPMPGLGSAVSIDWLDQLAGTDVREQQLRVATFGPALLDDTFREIGDDTGHLTEL